ncbi:MAG TPA: hypothetical protein VFZ25_09165 [Chloroflexota bacterium]|nr:hypothetical protein [Chloroflexota bacterium]
MRPIATGFGVSTLLVVIALILAILAIAGVFTPLLLVEIAVICLAIAMLV